MPTTPAARAVQPLSRAAVVLVPVQRLEVAKSRLAALGDHARRDLALAFALDTLELAAAAPGVVRVVAVTDDHVVAAAARDLGAHVAPGGPGLNQSLQRAGLRARTETGADRLVALCADLPAATAEDLAGLLAHPGPHAVVVDHLGVGSTALLDDEGWTPRFGEGSARAHVAAGHLAVVTGPGLRTDVDTPADLATATRLGLRPRTRAVVAGLD